ncbi:Kelch-like protein 10 [Cichlidogyrus casuarinus]|uniref:Kelch-like protein 10 n=1 Tax=Cichlidogyrus casuarinus TaxID=1844966 RepID=A0ABD2PP30_9PLAT
MTSEKEKGECYFRTNLPSYVLDRKVIINDNHEHNVSGFKLAKASEQFRKLLVSLRKDELQKKKETHTLLPPIRQIKRSRSLSVSVCELELKPLILNYDDLFGIEYVLSYVHNSIQIEEEGGVVLDEPSDDQLHQIISAALHFEVDSILDHVKSIILRKLNHESVWFYWQLLSNMKHQALEKLSATVKNYLCRNIVQCCESCNFLELSIERMKEILSTDELHLPRESLIMKPINDWLSHNEEERGKHCPELLSCLRLGRMSSDEILSLLRNPFVTKTMESCDHLIRLAQTVRGNLLINPSINLSDLSGGDAQLQIYMARPRLPHAVIIAMGGWEGSQDEPNFGPSRSLQIYNSRTNEWTRLTKPNHLLTEGRAYSGCVFYQDKVYLVGGYLISGPTQTCMVFDLNNSEWKYRSPMHEKRNYVSVVQLNGKIYALGGHNGKLRLNTAEVYSVEDNLWTFISPMNQIRSDAGATVLKGKLYIAGGFDGQHFYDTAESYNPETDQWTMIGSMQNIRSGVSLTALGNYLYALGGNDGLQRLRTVERYDPETGQWHSMPSMIRQRSNFCVTMMEDSIYVIGGWSDETNSTISLVERWTPAQAENWKAVKEIPFSASANCCSTIGGFHLISGFL